MATTKRSTTKKPRKPSPFDRPGFDDACRAGNVRSLTDDLRAISMRSVLVASAAEKGELPAKVALRSAQLDSSQTEIILAAIDDEASS